MKKLFKLLMMAVLVTACSTGNHADFEKNTATAKKYLNYIKQKNLQKCLK